MQDVQGNAGSLSVFSLQSGWVGGWVGGIFSFPPYLVKVQVSDGQAASHPQLDESGAISAETRLMSRILKGTSSYQEKRGLPLLSLTLHHTVLNCLHASKSCSSELFYSCNNCMYSVI